MKIVKSALVALSAAALSLSAVGPAQAVTSCTSYLVESFSLHYSGSSTVKGYLDRYDTPYSCPSNPSYAKKTYTVSRLGGAWHQVKHNIVDPNTGVQLRTATYSGSGTLDGSGHLLTNRTAEDYQISGFLVTDANGKRLYLTPTN